MAIHGAIPRGSYKQQPKHMPRGLGFARHLLGFNGVDQFVDLGTDPSLYPPAFTLSAMMRVRNIVEAMPLAHWHTDLPSPALYFNWGRACFYYRGYDGTTVNGRRWYQSPVNILDRNWHFVELTNPGMAVADIHNTHLYADLKAQEIALTEEGSVVAPMQRLQLAVDRALHWSNIELAVLLLYNRVLTTEERAYNMFNYHDPIRSGLVLWLPMEEGTGETIYDRSGNGHNGTLLPAGAGPTWERIRQWELRAAAEE